MASRRTVHCKPCRAVGWLLAVTIASIGASIGLPGAGVFAQDEESAIRYRQGVMKAIGGHMLAIGQIARGGVPHRDHLAQHTRALRELSDLVTAAFEADAIFGETRAKESIWDDWEGFRRKASALRTAARALAEAASAGDNTAFRAALSRTEDACKECHETFRERR